jgi:molecular chaperone HtpG
LQSDGNVKKISSHITKKVADRLNEIFKADRAQFEEKWDNLKLFIQYGMLSDEKFYERGEKFALLKNVDGKYFTFEEYKTLVGENQKDKNGDVIYLYASNSDEQYSYIQHAKDKGYDVLIMDGQLDVHVVSQLEQKFEKTRFVRVDSDVIDKIIQKDDNEKVTLTDDQRDALVTVFDSQIPSLDKTNFIVTFEQLSAVANPVFVTQNEFMRRMKEMSAMQGGMMSFYGEMPDSYNLVVNTAHPVIEKLLAEEEAACGANVAPFNTEIALAESKKSALKDSHKGKKDEEIPVAEKAQLEDIEKQIQELTDKKKAILKSFATETKQVRQLVDLALLANNMLKGEALANFVKRSVELL